MKIIQFRSIAIFVAVLLTAFSTMAQTALIKRTAFKSDSVEFGVGGTVTVTGAPFGSIRIEGWSKNEIEVSAEIQIEAANEADLAKLAGVNGFVLDSTFNHLRINSVGTHDKNYLKKSGKKIPKTLLGLPFRIDYVIKVPRYCDLNINGGSGDFFVSGVDGNMRVNFVKGDAKMSLDGGAIQAIFGTGNVDVTIPSRSWRGRFADVQLTSGTMNVFLPPGLNAMFDAAVLRTGNIGNTFTELKPRTRSDKFDDKLMVAKAGVGGVPMKFTVGDGVLNIAPIK
ncbi:MAG: hypothetical protein IPN69_20290 [Acidobacteria bacterium]|nr:hypothetical protein [Acidobacteriota bacterium]MBK8146809.1 hypothetical protein [Acidobacteriota bacterium]MBK8813051.1 hypothetical protein [Acidobacteriota bacterium]